MDRLWNPAASISPKQPFLPTSNNPHDHSASLHPSSLSLSSSHLMRRPRDDPHSSHNKGPNGPSPFFPWSSNPPIAHQNSSSMSSLRPQVTNDGLVSNSRSRSESKTPSNFMHVDSLISKSSPASSTLGSVSYSTNLSSTPWTSGKGIPSGLPSGPGMLFQMHGPFPPSHPSIPGPTPPAAHSSQGNSIVPNQHHHHHHLHGNSNNNNNISSKHKSAAKEVHDNKGRSSSIARNEGVKRPKQEDILENMSLKSSSTSSSSSSLPDQGNNNKLPSSSGRSVIQETHSSRGPFAHMNDSRRHPTPSSASTSSSSRLTSVQEVYSHHLTTSIPTLNHPHPFLPSHHHNHPFSGHPPFPPTGHPSPSSLLGPFQRDGQPSLQPVSSNLHHHHKMISSNTSSTPTTLLSSRHVDTISSRVCDNNNSSAPSAFSLVKKEKARTNIISKPEMLGPVNHLYHRNNNPITTITDDHVPKKDVNENSSEGPSTSVSPSGSTTSNHSSSGGQPKSLKKMWTQKYQGDATGDLSSQLNGSSLKAVPESLDNNKQTGNGLNGSSTSHNHNNNNNMNLSASSEEKSSTSSSSLARLSHTGEKITNNVSSANSSKRKGKKTPCRDSDATDSGSDTDPGDGKDVSPGNARESNKKKATKTGKRKVPIMTSPTSTASNTNGQKRGSSSNDDKEKKVKKIKAQQYSHSTYKGNDDEDDSTSPTPANSVKTASNNSYDDNRLPKKKSTLNDSHVDSESTEDESEMMTVTAESSTSLDRKGLSSSTSSSKTGKSLAKRGRKPKAPSSEKSGKSSPTASISSNSSKKKEKSKKEKGDSLDSGLNTNKATKRKAKMSLDIFNSIDNRGPVLQNYSCSDIIPRGASSQTSQISRCRECKMTKNQQKNVGSNIFCRFYHFRKLAVADKELGVIKAAGFSEPKDAKDEDIKLWLPQDSTWRLNKKDAKFLIEFVGEHFCSLVAQEAKAIAIHLGPLESVAWKSVVAGVREMCDVCDTTLFNMHWCCSECGLSVCIDCYKSRRDQNEKDSIKKDSDMAHPNTLISSSQGNNENLGESEISPPSLDIDVKSSAVTSPSSKARKDQDNFGWLLCNNKQPHRQDKLMLTHIIAKTALWDVAAKLHQVRSKLELPCSCDNESCVQILIQRNLSVKGEKTSTEISLKDTNLNTDKKHCVEENKVEPAVSSLLAGTLPHNQENQENKHLLPGGVVKQEPRPFPPDSALATAASVFEFKDYPLSDTSSLPESFLKKELVTGGGGQPQHQHQQEENRSDEEDFTVKNFLAVRELLSKADANNSSKKVSPSLGLTTLTPASSTEVKSSVTPTTGKKGGKSASNRKSPVLSTGLNGVLKTTDSDTPSLEHFHRRITPIFVSKNLPPRSCRYEETSKEFPGISHDWFCDGRLLVLKNPGVVDSTNLPLFEQQWIRHQPVVVCKVNEWLERRLWTPSTFLKYKKFTNTTFDLINTETDEVIRNQTLKDFFSGFEDLKNRVKMKNGKHVVYKMKDWPPGEEFDQALPEQFTDLMSCIPLPEYTTHDGTRNLAGRLPRSFGLIPDLGPKMYTAYGLASDAKGTTKLHLDVSDAVNVMVYVGALKGKDEKEHQKNVKQALQEAGVDEHQLERVNGKEKLGALWHIYDARDADKIRDMLNKFKKESGKKLEPHDDPIHDQAYYLDSKLRERLKKEYQVVGYTILQFYGDAIFIPAGAPHQVRNLSSCIKIAEDFVSPENVAHCFNLTEEFRQLSKNHDNHEDKLQIKNIIYHTVKDAIVPFTLDDDLKEHETQK